MKKILAFGVCAFLCTWFVFGEANLSGKWKLNEKQSDDPREKFQQAMRNNHHDGGGGFEGGHGMPSGGFGGRGGGFGGHRGDKEERTHMFEAPLELTISYNAPVFRTIDNSGNDRSLFTDGRKNEIELDNGRKMISTAHWEEDLLVVETQGPNGGTIRQTYELSTDAKQLFVKLRIPTPFSDDAVQIIRVYDAEPPESSPQTNQSNPSE